MSKRERVVADDNPLVSNPFAALHVEGAAAGPTGTPAAAPAPPALPRDPRPCGSLVVRRQKKGQGGKTVTCVEGLGLGAAQASEWLRALKQELGCSGRQTGDMLVLGTKDHARVAQWLRDAGASNVTLGN